MILLLAKSYEYVNQFWHIKKIIPSGTDGLIIVYLILHKFTSVNKIAYASFMERVGQFKLDSASFCRI